MLTAADTGLRERVYALQRAHLSRTLERALGAYVHELDRMTMVDIGCGRGYWADHFQAWGMTRSRIFGVDSDPVRIAQAQASNVCVADARALPFTASAFDMVSQFTLFSSLRKSADRRVAASEMLRVLKPGGLVLWHDFFVPNPLNQQTRAVSRREIQTLFRGCDIRFQTVTLLAPLARAAFLLSSRLVHYLERIPGLRTHYLALIRKPS